MSQSHQRSARAIPTASSIEASQFLAEFDSFLETVRGLTSSTRRSYGRFVKHFLQEWPSGVQLEWQNLSAEALHAYVERELSSKTRRPSNAPFVVLRAMLRYLAFKGLVAPGIENALPRIRRWRHAALPVYLSSDEVDRVTKSAADRNTLQPLRNTAIVLLLARTGMRAGEVAKLTLDDIDWGNGVIHVRGTKSRCDRELPLARDVGRGLLAYIKRERPTVTHRNIFIEATPPWRPFLDSSGISKIVWRALTRAGIPSARGAAHLLRHAAATNMLRRGTSFKGIADVLGHHSLQSTAIYAKLDLSALSRIAMPWLAGRRSMNREELVESRLTQYIEHRESLGYRQSHRGILTRFVRDHATEHPGEPIEADHVLTWIMQVRRAPQTQSAILGALRGFLRFLNAVDPATTIPDKHLLRSPIRNPPFIWNAEQLRSVLKAAANVRPRGGLRANAYVTVLGLLASSGLRIGEALRLKVSDVRLEEAVAHLVVRETKFNKSRIVPLHPTTACRLRQYADRRASRCHARQSGFFFVTDCGRSLDQKYLERWFSRITDKLSLRSPTRKRPTLHSLRHTFAVNRLAQWYEEQVPVWDMIPNLSVYLGHVSPSDSYWYLSATPGLLAGASDRFATFAALGEEQ